MKAPREKTNTATTNRSDAKKGKGQAVSPPTYGLPSVDGPVIQMKKKKEEELKKKKPIQAKLKIGQSGDKYEREADAVADQVVRMSKADVQVGSLEEDTLQSKPLAHQISPLQSDHASTEAGSSLESRLNASKGSGQPLPQPTLSFMEQAFGTDFSGVRVHTGPEAVRMSEEVGAKAFTVGGNVYFNQGQFQPETGAGKWLLGHELGHVVQQNILGTNQKHEFTGGKCHDSMVQRTGNHEIEEITFEVPLASFPQALTEKYYIFYESFAYNMLIERLNKVRLPKSWGPDIMGFRSNFRKAVFDRLLAKRTLPECIILNVLVAKGKTVQNSHIFFYMKEKKAPVIDEKEMERLDKIWESIQQREKEKAKEEQRKSYQFRIRTISGGEGGVILGGTLITFELQAMRNGRPKEKVFITFTGIGLTVGYKAGGYGVSDWTEFRTTVPMKLEDFEGRGVLESASITAGGGVGGTVLYFFCNRSLDDIPTQSVIGFGGLTGLAAGASGYVGKWSTR